jgi:NAD(P)-dependent dehydrogenase (short-subunit alcohol dehydrogenase family)
MGKLDGKVAVVTGGSSGIALTGAKLFVGEGAHVVILGRRQEALAEAVELIVRKVTAVQADSDNLDDLDRCSTRSGRKRAPSTCCGEVPGRPRKASSARSPRAGGSGSTY